jgi:hypothetical protein
VVKIPEGFGWQIRNRISSCRVESRAEQHSVSSDLRQGQAGGGREKDRGGDVRLYLKGLIGERLNDRELWAREFFVAWDDWIYKLAPLAKSATWESERECRIVHELKVAEFPRVRFAQKKTVLARYLPLGFPCWVKERASRLPIASVMIGPGDNLASTRVSALLLLEQMGYPEVPVEITTSTLTDR